MRCCFIQCSEGRPVRYLTKLKEEAVCQFGKKEFQAEGKGNIKSLCWGQLGLLADEQGDHSD